MFRILCGKQTMIDKINCAQTLDRWLAFVERRLGNGILAKIEHPMFSAHNGMPGEIQTVRGRDCLVLENPAKCVARTVREINETRDALSDILPSAYPTYYFGESVWAAIFGGEITFAGTDHATWSYCARPPLQDLDRFDFPPLRHDDIWIKKMLGATAYFVANMKPVCDMQPFILIDCLNLLSELRGAATALTDLYDAPEWVKKFMEWSITVNMSLYDRQAEIIHDFVTKAYGDHPFFKYACCCVPHMSIDAYGHCAAEVYERFGLPYHVRMAERYGGGRLHIHSNARRLCKLVSRIGTLTYCSMTEDVGFPPAWQSVSELKEQMSPVPIAVTIPKEAFVAGIENRSLPGGVLYSLRAESLDEANSIMKRVFEYRARVA
jgi:hypothetical protein